MYRIQFSKVGRFVSADSEERHPKFQDVEPLSIKEMLRRANYGIPLSVPVAPQDRIPINNSFFVDKFDVLDTAIRADQKIAEEKKQEFLAQQAEQRKQLEDFKKWQEEQKRLSLEQSVQV